MMENKQAIEQAAALLQPYATEIKPVSDLQIDVYVDKANVLPAVTALANERWGYVSAITGVDIPAKDAAVDKESGQETSPAAEAMIELIYTICHHGAVTNLRTLLPYSDLTVDSICSVVPSVSLFERELIEILGVTFIDTPNTDHLILPDSWPQGVYPLRKSFTGLQQKPGPAL